ncbi:hypothetical protein [Fischerella thermalis]|uniref:hypothetical protein n=1 Tax=Fischerella thermalis TaxID=372787 RepID=UPI0015E109E8|nr:hypothetical protein [Fischerella thermalis]
MYINYRSAIALFTSDAVQQSSDRSFSYFSSNTNADSATRPNSSGAYSRRASAPG